MKKLSLICYLLSVISLTAFAQVDETFQFVDAEGNVVSDGTVITVSEVDPESGMMVVPLSVRNISGQKAAVSMLENIDNKPNGDWQTCAFGNCMILNETGYSPKNIVAADYNASIQTEWIPVEEEYATWEATLQIHVFNIVTKSSFGQLIEQPGDEVIGYGPKVTVRFEYKDPAQQEKAKVWWGYVGENDAVYGLGTQAAETYHCASFYAGDNEVAAGKTIQAVRFNLLSSNVKNVKVWIAASLPTTVDEANVIELVEVKSPVTGVNEVTLPTPYTIGANGVYVGYTFTITKVAKQDDAYPIPVSGSDLADALWLRTSSSVNSWTNMYGQGFGRLYLQLLLEGEFPYANAASVALANIGESVGVIGGTAPAYLPVTNMGTNSITSIDYTVTSDGVTGAEQHVDVASPIGFGNTQVLTITVNADEEAGTKNKTLTITKVNGVANECDAEQTQFTVATVSRLADHVIAVEENTGTGCGWCPRGMVGMEKIRKAFGDKAVGIAIHRYNSTDAMYISAYSQVSFNNSAPACRVNRGEIIDPYTGSNGNILDDVDYALSIPAKAAISVTGEWSEDGKKVNATATIESLMPGQNYKIEYVLVADGLSGTGSAWTQQNYYATNYTAAQLPSDLADFGSGGKLGNSSLTGLTFNDVAIAVGKSTQTTAPGTLALGEQVTNTYTLSLPTKTTLLNAIKKDKVTVVALLIANDKTIANAAKFLLPEYVEPSGVSTVRMGDDVTPQQHYSLDGRQLQGQQKGLNIIRMSDGSVKKVMMK